VLEGDVSIRVELPRIHQTWLHMVGQGGRLSACTQATMNHIIPLPLHRYIISLSLSLSLSIFLCVFGENYI
jgi:hypothetical protein